ncbi:MAG TPA: hypothetical protein PKO06_08165, partial [Candidatus Ozemobacteraceae bacterium]|nr:hypothetical protein [Candidatus Ozemobacteraceae bacterium]
MEHQNVLKPTQTTIHWSIRLCFHYVFWSLFLEGVIRKWVLPGSSNLVFFMKDPAVLIIYLYFLRRGLMPGKMPFTSFFYLLTFFGFVSVFQPQPGLIFNYLGLYGWRNYFFFVPLAFIIAEYLPKPTLYSILRQFLWFSIPIAVLVFLQHNAPGGAVINAGISGAFGSLPVSRGFIRPNGPFSFVHLMNCYNLILWGCILGLWAMRAQERPVSRYLLVAAALSGVASVAVSGSRAAVAGVGLVALFLFLGISVREGIGKGSFFSSTLSSVTFLFATGYIALQFFYEPLEGLRERAESIVALEERMGLGWGWGFGLINRFFYDMISFWQQFSQVPILGNGLGLSSTAAIVFGTNPGGIENDWDRHIYELGPVMGVGFIFLRVWITVWLFKRTLEGVSHGTGILGFLIVGGIFHTVLLGQLG